MTALVYRFPVVPSDFTGTIPETGTIQPALWGDIPAVCRTPALLDTVPMMVLLLCSDFQLCPAISPAL